MPVSREKQKLYPGGSLTSRLWKDLQDWVRARSGNRCEGSPKYPQCRAFNGAKHPVTGSIVVLTVAHVAHDPSRNGPADLRHWCQRCHNAHDVDYRRGVRRATA